MSVGQLIKRLLGRGEAPLDTDEVKQLARHEDARVRSELASRQDVQPEILYYLAEDPSPEVRRVIAGNQATPVQADLLLATDADDEVRSGLAQKIARLAPGLSKNERNRIRRMTYEVLELLARDQITRIRQILAEELKDVANAPPEVINRLARDAQLSVAAPVLEFSPVLSDEDLLEIIESGPVRGCLAAISRRSQVDSSIAEAIASSDDIDAIAVLLGNPSAQIREETLDRLMERAPDIESWHAPMVRRPKLSPKAAARLASFVADNLLKTLEERRDFTPETLAAVAAAVHRRLAEQPSLQEEPHAWRAERVDSPYDMARQMHAAGKLDEGVLAKALTARDEAFVVAALAVRANVPPELVEKVIETRSAKGMCALAWRAALTMPFAVQLQTRLARVAPADTLRSKGGTQYPLSVDEMAWQIEFFSSLVRKEGAAG